MSRERTFITVMCTSVVLRLLVWNAFPELFAKWQLRRLYEYPFAKNVSISLREPTCEHLENKVTRNYNKSVVLWGLATSSNMSFPLYLKFLPNYKNPCWFDGPSDVLGLKCLPYFYVLGVGKSGTTTLFSQLVKHPEIAKPPRKELFFWNFVKQRNKLPGYIERFRNARHQIFNETDKGSNYHPKILFEGTPAYFSRQGHLAGIPGNYKNGEPTYTLAHTLYTLYPQTRLIVIMRHPTDRLYSHYRHFNKKFSPGEFHKHTVTALRMMKICLANRTLRSCAFDHELNFKIRQGKMIMLHYSMYYPYAKEWLRVFPRHQMMFIKGEEFFTNPKKIMKEVFRFLCVKEPSVDLLRNIQEEMQAGYNQEMTKNTKNNRTQIWTETRTLLDNFFKAYNGKLANLLHDKKWLFIK